MKRNKFTVIEVICAIFILTSAVTILMWQMSIVSKRISTDYCEWIQVHNLVQASEFILIHGIETPFDEDILLGNYSINISLNDVEFPLKKIPLSKKILKNMVVNLYDSSGEEVDSLSMDIFIEE